MSWVREISVIGLYTLRLLLRRPIVLIMTLSGLLLMAALPGMVVFSLGDENRLVRDGALAVLFMNGLLLAMAAAVAAPGAAADDNLALILCKPVARHALFAGRCAGLALAVVWYVVVSFCGVLLAALAGSAWLEVEVTAMSVLWAAPAAALSFGAWRNFQRRRLFVESAALALPWCMLAALAVVLVSAAGPGMVWRMLPAGLLAAMALCLMALMAACLLVRLPAPAALSVCGVTLVLGALSDYMAARFDWGMAGRMLAALLPAWQDFWMADALAGNGFVPWGYVGAMAVYTGLYAAALVCAGMALFAGVEPR